MTPPEKQRTVQQNKALHLYFEFLAERLNEAGLDMRVVLKPEVEILWTKESVKDHLWRPVQDLYLKKDSTTELTTDKITKVYEDLNRFPGEKHGVYEAFPSIENLGDILTSIIPSACPPHGSPGERNWLAGVNLRHYKLHTGQGAWINLIMKYRMLDGLVLT